MSHDWETLHRVATEERSPAALGPFTPWQCEYQGHDGLYCIILHGIDPEQVWQANVGKLHMRNGAHEGVTKDDAQAMWEAASTRGGYAAVDAFLRSIIGEARA